MDDIQKIQSRAYFNQIGSWFIAHVFSALFIAAVTLLAGGPAIVAVLLGLVGLPFVFFVGFLVHESLRLWDRIGDSIATWWWVREEQKCMRVQMREDR